MLRIEEKRDPLDRYEKISEREQTWERKNKKRKIDGGASASEIRRTSKFAESSGRFLHGAGQAKGV